MVDLRLNDLTKVFSTPSGEEVAVDGVNLNIDHGSFVSFVGPSGCGKTTLLRMIAGLEEPTSGEIRFDDEVITDLPPQQRDIAMVFQDVTLYPHMTIYDNIGYGLKVRGETEEYDEKITWAADLLEISELLDKKPGQLSGGQRQRVALGRAIVRDPNVILLDEPMSDLDAKLKATLRVEVQKVHQEVNSTMIYVTHDQEEAMTMSTDIALMNDGKIEQFDEPDVLFQSPTSEFSARFIGQPSMNVVNCNIAQNGNIQLYTHQINTDNIHEESHLDIDDSEIKLGFRPQHIVFTKDPDESLFNLEVEVCEPIGTEYIIHTTDAEGNRVKGVASDISDLREGESIGVKDLEKVYGFDLESGEKIFESEDVVHKLGTQM